MGTPDAALQEFHEDVGKINFFDVFSQQELQVIQSMDQKAAKTPEYMQVGLQQLAYWNGWIRKLYNGGSNSNKDMAKLLIDQDAGQEEMIFIQLYIKRKFKNAGKENLLPAGFAVDGNSGKKTYDGIRAFGKEFLGQLVATSYEGQMLDNGGVANRLEDLQGAAVVGVIGEKMGNKDITAKDIGDAVYKGNLTLTIQKQENLRDRMNIERIVGKGSVGDTFQVIGIRIPPRGQNVKYYYAVVKDAEGKSFFVCLNDGDKVKLSINGAEGVSGDVPEVPYAFGGLNISKYASEYYRINGEKNEKVNLCAAFADSTMVQLLARNNLFFPANYAGFDAWQRGDMFAGKPCKKVDISACSDAQKKSEIVNAGIGAQLTVQYAESHYLSKGITHTLVHLGNGLYTHMFGEHVSTIDMKKMPIQRDAATGVSYFVWEGKRFNFVKGNDMNTTSYLYSPECTNTLRCTPYALKNRVGTSSFDVASTVAEETGLPGMYCFGLVQEAIYTKTGKTDFMALTESEIPTISISVPLGLHNTIVYDRNAGVLRVDVSKAPKAQETIDTATQLAQIGITIPSDNIALLGAIHNAETGGHGFKATMETWYARSILGENDYNSGETHSLGPYQVQTRLAKNMIQQNAVLRSQLAAVIRSPYFLEDAPLINITKLDPLAADKKEPLIHEINTHTLSYDHLAYLLYSPLSSLLISNTICDSDKNMFQRLAENANIPIAKEDLYLTTMFSYNHGYGGTIDAIMQQHFAKMAVSLGIPLQREEEVTYNTASGIPGASTGPHTTTVNKKYVIDGDGGVATQELISRINTRLQGQGRSPMQVTLHKGNITHIDGVLVTTNTIGQIAMKFDEILSSVPFYPALDGEFLRGNKHQAVAPYAQQFNVNVKQTGNNELYQGERYEDARTSYIRSKYEGAHITYPALGPDKVRRNRYNAATKKGELDCIGFIQHVAGRLGDRNMENTYHGLFASETQGTVACITPQVQKNYDAYLREIQDVKPGDIVGIGRVWSGTGAREVETSAGKKSIDLRHGGVVTRVEKQGGKVVNVYCVHSSSENLKGPVEVPLFGPTGYVNKVINDPRKNTIFIGHPKADFYA